MCQEQLSIFRTNSYLSVARLPRVLAPRGGEAGLLWPWGQYGPHSETLFQIVPDLFIHIKMCTAFFLDTIFLSPGPSASSTLVSVWKVVTTPTKVSSVGILWSEICGDSSCVCNLCQLPQPEPSEVVVNTAQHLLHFRGLAQVSEAWIVLALYFDFKIIIYLIFSIIFLRL